MDQSSLSSRAIMGMYYRGLDASAGIPWVNAVSNLFNSDQASEEYRFLGQSPAMREWIGGRNAKGFRDNGLTILNKHYEATIEVALKDLRRDKTPQIKARIDDLIGRTESHWASLVATLILNGESTACYDGQFFFDTDHSEGDSGTQSNDISADISGYPVEVSGSTTAPSRGEMEYAILDGINAIMGFKDDQGEPMNESAQSFAVLTGMSLRGAAISATKNINQGTTERVLEGVDEMVTVYSSPRFNTWTTKFAIFRTDSPIKALIRQSETEPDMKVKDENSDFAFDNDAVQFGVDAWRNAGYGYWQHACLVTLV